MSKEGIEKNKTKVTNNLSLTQLNLDVRISSILINKFLISKLTYK